MSDERERDEERKNGISNAKKKWEFLILSLYFGRFHRLNFH